jgi:hypothetical protein
VLSAPTRADDREAIAELVYPYTVDVLGCHPVARGDDDPTLPQAAKLFAECLADDVRVRLQFEGPGKPQTHATSVA